MPATYRRLFARPRANPSAPPRSYRLTAVAAGDSRSDDGGACLRGLRPNSPASPPRLCPPLRPLPYCPQLRERDSNRPEGARADGQG
eukprot:scaffold17701_cov113-Isochrysis_galbana.AAC.3